MVFQCILDRAAIVWCGLKIPAKYCLQMIEKPVSAHLTPTRKQVNAAWRLRSFAALLAVIAATMLFCTTIASAQTSTDAATEYKVKVAYIYNFSRYIDWPSSAFNRKDSPLIIGVLGEDPFGAAIDRLAGRKKVKRREIVVRRYGTWQDYRSCHVLFVAATSSDELREWAVQSTRGRPVLVIGETAGYAARGAGVNFFIDVNNTVGFEINIDAMGRQKLRVDAKLLKLARVVRDGDSS